jgi:hypothetical protein
MDADLQIDPSLEPSRRKDGVMLILDLHVTVTTFVTQLATNRRRLAMSPFEKA